MRMYAGLRRSRLPLPLNKLLREPHNEAPAGQFGLLPIHRQPESRRKVSGFQSLDDSSEDAFHNSETTNRKFAVLPILSRARSPSTRCRHGDEFGVRIAEIALDAALGAEAAIANPAEGGFRRSDEQVVDRHHPGAQR